MNLDFAEIWNGVLEKASVAGVEALSHSERTVFLVNAFLVDLESGGLTGALYNASGRLEATAQAFSAAGATRAAETLREAAALLEPLVASQAATWGEFLHTTSADRRVDAWNEAFTPGINELYAALEAFTVSHASELPSGPAPPNNALQRTRYARR